MQEIEKLEKYVFCSGCGLEWLKSELILVLKHDKVMGECPECEQRTFSKKQPKKCILNKYREGY